MALANTLGRMLALQEALHRAQDEDFFGLSTTSGGNFPPVCVFRDEHGFVVRIEIPGIDKSKLNLEVSNDLLRISGERIIDVDRNEVSIHRIERNQGRFDRMVRLPEVLDANTVKAEYRDGILTVKLAQSEASKPKKIAIN
jgi:HSP20 family protein